MKRLCFGLMMAVLIAGLLAGCGGGGGKKAAKSVALPDSLLAVLEDAYYMQQATDEYLEQTGIQVSFETHQVAEKTYGPWYLKDGWYEGSTKETKDATLIEETVKINEDGNQIEITRKEGGVNYAFRYELAKNADSSITGTITGTKTAGSSTVAFQIDLADWKADKFGTGSYTYSEGADASSLKTKIILSATYDESTPAMALSGTDEGGNSISTNGAPALYYKVLNRLSNAYFLEGAFESYFEQVWDEMEIAMQSAKIKKLSGETIDKKKLSGETIDKWVWNNGYWKKTDSSTGEEVRIKYIPFTKTTNIVVTGSNTEKSYKITYNLTEDDDGDEISGTIDIETTDSSELSVTEAMQIVLDKCDLTEYGSGDYKCFMGSSLESLTEYLNMKAEYERPYMKLTGWLKNISNTFSISDATPYSGN